MKALTILQPWASLTMIGARPYHFARYAPPARLIEERVVIYAAPHPMEEAQVERLHIELSLDGPRIKSMKLDLALPFVREIWRGMIGEVAKVGLPLEMGLGTVRLGRPIKVAELYPDDPGVDQRMLAWPMNDPEEFRRPVFMRGIPQRGVGRFWGWPEQAREAA